VGRILGLDYGRRRIGVAVSDPLGVTAHAVETWKGLRWESVREKIRTLVKELGIERIVVGFPLTLKGEKGRMAREAERFASGLKKKMDVPVILWDERLTSIQAQRVLQTLETRSSRKKEEVDLMASVFILQSYLDRQKSSLAPSQGEES